MDLENFLEGNLGSTSGFPDLHSPHAFVCLAPCTDPPKMDEFMLWGMGYSDSGTHHVNTQESGGHNLLDLAASVVGNSEMARCSACAQEPPIAFTNLR